MAEPDEPIRTTDDGVEIAVSAVPRASRSRVVGLHDGRVKVQIAAPPVDGAANAELTVTLAKALGLPARALEVTSGQTSKRKSVRARGIGLEQARTRLGLTAIGLPLWLHGLLSTALVGLVVGCQPTTTEVQLRVVLPADASDLDATNNVTLVLHPDGFSQTIATIGIDFALDAELEPDSKLRQLDVYLARNETLLAWGRTPSFTYDAAAGRGAAVFVARPGRLSTFPLRFALDDPDVSAAHAFGHGLVILSGDGTTTYLDGLTLDIMSAAPLSATTGKLPAADDGTFVGDALGGVQRVAWDESLRAFRFDPGDNTWIERSLAEASNVEPRPGAAHLVDDAREVLLLYGGGDQTDVLAVNLLPGGPAVERVEGITLDAPRRGASAMALVREGIGLDSAVLFGSDDPASGVVHLAGRDQTVGPDGPWLGGSCVQLDRGGANASLRVLCAGGLRDDAPTSDAILLTVPGLSSDDPPTAQELPALLESPMEHVFWLLEGDAVHAQGGGRLVRIERETLAVEEIQEAARSRGGSCVRLPTGLSFLVGGIDGDGSPVPSWQVFMPSP